MAIYLPKGGESRLDDINVLERILINNNTDSNKSKYKGVLALEHIFGFCETFKKITKNL